MQTADGQAPDWGAAYREHQRCVVEQIGEARRRGVASLRLASGRWCNPQRLRPRAVADLALRDAESIVNVAIHQHNEAA
jgi:hypothetical protein